MNWDFVEDFRTLLAEFTSESLASVIVGYKRFQAML
jgi:hypothetical protein